MCAAFDVKTLLPVRVVCANAVAAAPKRCASGMGTLIHHHRHLRVIMKGLGNASRVATTSRIRGYRTCTWGCAVMLVGTLPQTSPPARPVAPATSAPSPLYPTCTSTADTTTTGRPAAGFRSMSASCGPWPVSTVQCEALVAALSPHAPPRQLRDRNPHPQRVRPGGTDVLHGFTCVQLAVLDGAAAPSSPSGRYSCRTRPTPPPAAGA